MSRRMSVLVLSVTAAIGCSASMAADDPGMGKDLAARSEERRGGKEC